MIILPGILFSSIAEGTPMYAGRSGRTCDNCHLDPNGWKNPSLAERKCSLSCQVCHVDPAGGGMRNAAGRFYGRSTLPIIATSPRPTRDWDRDFLPYMSLRMDRATTYSHDLPRGPSDLEESKQYEDQAKDWWSYGRPAGGTSQYAFFQGRYGSLRADPLLSIGFDIRLAMLVSETTLRFPMQGDIPFAFHPLKHATLFLNTGFRGRTSGYSDTFDDSRTPYFREAFLLLHQAPYQAYLKAGRFTPAYGLRLDDHTSFIRRSFELDGSLPETRVTGVEAGAAPNYPFINFSWFKITSQFRSPDSFDIFDLDSGWGTALNIGYRELGWSAGGSMLLKRRPLDEGGDLTAAGFYAIINPWYYRSWLPLTYQVELDLGKYSRASGNNAKQNIFYQELDWYAANGINVLLTHDFADPDREVIDDHSHRVSGGIQITPYPGFTIDTRIRSLFPAGGKTDSDLFIQFHIWN
jgi:hypothetical protein